MATIREIGEAELERFLAVVDDAAPRANMGGVAGMVDWGRQAQDTIWLLADEDEEPVGAGFAVTGWHTPPHRGIASALVRPSARGHGIGDRLRGELERWSAERGITELDAPISEEDEGTIAWAAARGYEEAGRNSRMVLDLTTIEAPAVEPPPGIEIVTWAERPELAEGLWEVAREASPDIPGEEETDVGPLGEWLDRDMRGSGDRPEAVFVAVEDGEVLGYAKLAFSEDTAERAYHDLTGVKRAHRGRGIAALLKATQIAWAKEQGYAALQTSNEVRNAPIRHLNQKHGYVLEPGVVIVRRTIAGT
jgi:GNAT superfamily N-acetyltransferase